MSILHFLAIFLHLLVAIECNLDNPDILSDVSTITRRHGYQTTKFQIQTEDGYILTLFRILPKGKSDKPPIFIQHGFLGNCGPFVAASNPNRSLAFFLSDLGHEVWLGNYRGSTYSNRHISLSVNDGNFWNFTLDDVARIDIKAQLEVVAQETGKGGSIIYLGHNAGSTLAFMLASEFPEETQKLIQAIVTIGPIVYLKGTFHLGFANPLIVLAHTVGLQAGAYQEDFYHNFAVNACKLVPLACRWFLYLFYGKSVQLLNDDIPLFFSFWPSGTSVKFAHQYHQIYKSDEFKKYDFGKNGNLAAYGSSEVPFYDLGRITLPVYLFYGKRDAFYTQRNIDKLFEELGSTKKYRQEVAKGNDSFAFNHYDYLFGEYVRELFYPDLEKVLEEFSVPIIN